MTVCTRMILNFSFLPARSTLMPVTASHPVIIVFPPQSILYYCQIRDVVWRLPLLSAVRMFCPYCIFLSTVVTPPLQLQTPSTTSVHLEESYSKGEHCATPITL